MNNLFTISVIIIGKTVFLREVCRELVARECDVYFVASAANLIREMSELNELINFAELRFNSTGQRTYIAVDEAQSCQDHGVWLKLLRNSNLVVIVTGLPMEFNSPNMGQKQASSFIFFSEEEVSNEIFEIFKRYVASRHPATPINEAKLLDVLLGIWSYTGGHAFPFMHLCHYVCDKHINLVMEGYKAIDKLFRPASFMSSPIMNKLIERCFSFESPIRDALRKYLSSPSQFSYEDQRLISKFGFMENGRVLSDLFLQVVYADPFIFRKAAVVASNIEDAIAYALRNFTNDRFMEPDRINYAYENSVGFYFGAQLATIPGIYLKPQVQVARVDRNKPGHLPCVDFYVNGKLDVCIEIIRNTSNFEKHLDRFESNAGEYRHFRDNYVILDFQMDNKPILSTLPTKYEHLKEKIFTFSYLENCLYKGRIPIFPNICKDLHVDNCKNLGNSMQRYVDEKKRSE